MFSHRLNIKSTVFKIKRDARVLEINSFNDIWIDFTTGESNLALRKVKVGKNVSHQYQNHLFIDFEMSAKYYDVIYISQMFTKRVDWVLKEFESRVLCQNQKFDDQLTVGDLYISELFEDWNVESVLVLNKDSLIVEKYI